jgi:hypothetical protein
MTVYLLQGGAHQSIAQPLIGMAQDGLGAVRARRTAPYFLSEVYLEMIGGGERLPFPEPEGNGLCRRPNALGFHSHS